MAVLWLVRLSPILVGYTYNAQARDCISDVMSASPVCNAKLVGRMDSGLL